jgi:hypothetical protein
VIFEALAFLSAGPVHEKAEGAVDGCNRDEHVDGDAEGCDSCEEAEHQSQPAKELGRDCQEREHGWNVRRAREIGHGSREAVSAEPTDGDPEN